MREKRLPFSDAEALDEEEEPTKRQRTQFVELQPSQEDPGGAFGESRGMGSRCESQEAWPSPVSAERVAAALWKRCPKGCRAAADAIDEEVPGSVPAGVDPLVLADRPFHPYSPGGEASCTSSLPYPHGVQTLLLPSLLPYTALKLACAA
jgi:hypothetical protein